MIAVEDQREALVGEVLGPDNDVPEAVRYPRVVRLERWDCDMSYRVKLGDGGWWRFFEDDLLYFDRLPKTVDGELIQELFERRALRYDGRKRQ